MTVSTRGGSPPPNYLELHRNGNRRKIACDGADRGQNTQRVPVHSSIVTDACRQIGSQPGPLGWTLWYLGRKVSDTECPSHDAVTVTSEGVLSSRKTIGPSVHRSSEQSTSNVTGSNPGPVISTVKTSGAAPEKTTARWSPQPTKVQNDGRSEHATPRSSKAAMPRSPRAVMASEG